MPTTIPTQAYTGGTQAASDPAAPHEAPALALSIEKSQERLAWRPRWGLDETIRRTVTWYRAHHDGMAQNALRSLSESQISDYMTATSQP